MSLVGDTLKQLRQDADMTLRELAGRVYVHWSTLNKVEMGTRNLSPDVARALDVVFASGGVLTALVEGGPVMLVDDPVIVRIAPERYRRPKQMITYMEEAQRLGRELAVDHQTTQIPAVEQVAERLGIRAGDMVSQTRYVIRMNETVVCASHSWEPLALTAGTDIEDPHAGPYASTGLTPRFDAIGLHPTSVEESVMGSRLASPSEQAVFGVPPLTVLTEVHQVFLAGQTVIQAATMVFRASAYELHYRMEIK